MLAGVWSAQPGTRSSGRQSALALRDSLAVCSHEWRIPQNTQINGTRQRGAWQVEELAQQHHDPLRHLAHSEVQKPPAGHPFSFRAPSWDQSHLPTVWPTCPNLPLRTHPASKRPGELGTLAGVSSLFVQCRPRLLRGGQHRAARHGVPDPDASHRQSKSLLRDRDELGQARSLYDNGRGAAVSAAGPRGPPDALRQDLPQWVEEIRHPSDFVCNSSALTTLRMKKLRIADDSCRFRKRYLAYSPRGKRRRGAPEKRLVQRPQRVEAG